MNTVGMYGNRGIRRFDTLVRGKQILQERPVDSFLIQYVNLPECSGTLTEAAAVALGWRKKSARFVQSVEII